MITVEAAEGGSGMGEDEVFEESGESKMEDHKEEIRQKYGSKKLNESEKKTAKYTQADWDAIKAEAMEINEEIAAVMSKGPANPTVQELIGRFYKHINDRFYSCPPEAFKGLGEMYVADPRFTAFYERFRPGMAEFMRDAMQIFSDSMACGAASSGCHGPLVRSALKPF